MELLPIVGVFLMFAGFIWLFAMAKAAGKADKHLRDLVKKEATDNDS